MIRAKRIVNIKSLSRIFIVSVDNEHVANIFITTDGFQQLYKNATRLNVM